MESKHIHRKHSSLITYNSSLMSISRICMTIDFISLKSINLYSMTRINQPNNVNCSAVQKMWRKENRKQFIANTKANKNTQQTNGIKKKSETNQNKQNTANCLKCVSHARSVSIITESRIPKTPSKCHFEKGRGAQLC